MSEHIKHIFSSGELLEKATVRKYRTVQQEGKRTVSRNSAHYNLEVVISIGYRVNSLKATQFRQWATRTLKEYLVKGYAINEKRLAQKEQEVQVLKNGIQILSRVIEEKTEDHQWLNVFAKGLRLLDDYDHEALDAKGVKTKEAEYPSVTEYQKLINQMLTEFDSDVFGKEKDKSFLSSIAQIGKGFETTDFHPSIEEKAAMLFISCCKKSFFCRWQQTNCCSLFFKVFTAKRNAI